MGHASIVYGNIIATAWKSEDHSKLHRLNAAVIESLPAIDDQFPWITKGMFLVPADTQGIYRDQVIVFGASYKSVEYEWSEWLEKFESILKKLFWISATIHLETELFGDHKYEWLADCERMDGWFKDEPVVAALWEFKGGPRSFEQLLARDKN